MLVELMFIGFIFYNSIKFIGKSYFTSMLLGIFIPFSLPICPIFSTKLTHLPITIPNT